MTTSMKFRGEEKVQALEGFLGQYKVDGGLTDLSTDTVLDVYHYRGSTVMFTDYGGNSCRLSVRNEDPSVEKKVFGELEQIADSK